MAVMGNRVSILILAALLLGPCGSAFGMSIADVKLLPDGSPVTLTPKVVTYAAGDSFYIEEDSMPCGIRVEQPNHTFAVGTRAYVQGTVQTNANMERYIAASYTTHFVTGTIAPIYVNSRSVGGGDCFYDAITGAGQMRTTGWGGANNIGLLVKTSGLSQLLDATTFTIDDGTHATLRCVAPLGFLLYPGANHVSVTGISSMYPSGPGYAPILLVKDVELITSEESLATPGAPTGSPVPLIGGTYTYSTTGSGCSEGHTVQYSFDWGDGTISPWSTSRNATRSWSLMGGKSVTVTARCQTNQNLSVTSQALAVNVQSALSCEMINVPVGTFEMGNTTIYYNERPKHWVTVSPFLLGKYEVTRGQYQRFITAGGYTTPFFWSKAGWNWKMAESRTQPLFWNAVQNWGSGNFTQTDNHPVVGISYHEAEAFCNWAGGRLPTEAQWEIAARFTGTGVYKYPWGSTWADQNCNNLNDPLYPGCQTAPVGSYSAYSSPSGCRDMAGNVWEWCKDWYLSSYYSLTPPGGWVDPQGPADGVYRTLRGGGWGSTSFILRTAVRICDIPESSWFSSGFRLAR